MSVLSVLVGTVAFAVLGPVVGCLLSGLDRKISARMQGRVGPPLLQPYYDVRMCVFVVTLSSLFFIVAAYSTRSPYAELGAARETLQVMAYEPMVLFMAVAFFLAAGTFDVAGVFALDAPVVTTIWLAFLGFLFVLTVKLRKSPFDLSMSHHAHQEIVRGITTEMSGPALAKVEVMHWCENVLFLGWVGLFFVWGNPASVALGVVAALLAYFLEIWIDNNFARVKWQALLKSAWAVALVAGGVNVAVLAFL